MPIYVAASIMPKNGATWFIVEDKYVKGGFQVHATVAERNALPSMNLKQGMLCLTLDDGKVSQLQSDLVTWVDFTADPSAHIHAATDVTQDATHRMVADTDITNWNGKQNALGYTPENSANNGQPNGYASLDSSGKLPTAQLPALAITDTFVVASLAEQLAIAQAHVGDVCVRTDISKSFILKTSGPDTLSNWQELLTPTTGVVSVSVSAPLQNTGSASAPVIGLPAASATSSGYMSSTYASKLDGIDAGATAYTLPVASSTVMGGVKQGSGVSIDGAGVLSATVVSVAGKTGLVTLSASDIGLGNVTNIAPVTSVAVGSPLVTSGAATTPTISMPQATAAVDGYLSHADFAAFSGKQANLGFTPYNATNPSNYITTGASIGGDLSGTIANATVSKLQTKNISISSLTTGNVLQYDGTNWVNAAVVASVSSVNGNSGAITAAQIATAATAGYGFTPAPAYSLPTASTTVLGGVKVDGTTVTISSGVISATPAAVSSVFGRTGAVVLQQSDVTGVLGAGSITNTMLSNGAVANLSGTNTGDETASTIKTKLGIPAISGTNSGDQTISISGDVTAGNSSGSLAATVTKINGTSLAGLATGLLKNTTATGVPTIAIAGTDYVVPGAAAGTPSSINLTNATNVPAAQLSGAVPAANMPALTGDVTTTAGAVATTLSKIAGTTLTISGLTSGHTLQYDGTKWANVMPTSAPVASVAGLTGAITATGLATALSGQTMSIAGSSASTTGNAATATKLQTTRNIACTGDATGSASFDGSADASLAMTVYKINGITVDTSAITTNDLFQYDGTKWAHVAPASLTVGTATTATTANALNTANNYTVANLTLAGNLIAQYNGSQDLGSATNKFNNVYGQSFSGNAATVTTNANMTGDVTSVGNATTLAKIGGNPVTITSLASGQQLQYNGTAWVNVAPGSAPVTSVATLTGAITAANLATQLSGMSMNIVGSASTITGTYGGTLTSGQVTTALTFTPPNAAAGNNWTAKQTFSTSIKIQQVLELTTISATASSGTIQFDALTQGILYYTTAATGNWTMNFRGDSSNTLNNTMGVGESFTFAFLSTQGATAYYPTAITIDGAANTPKWLGGTAPTSGDASSIDVYSYTIIKTASAAFTVLAAVSKYA